MEASNRVYKRKKVFIPFVFSPDDSPPVASPTQALPVSPEGLVTYELVGGSMKNSSTDGFCFQTERKLKPGTTIEAKMINFTPLNLGEQVIDDCQARVKWCQESQSADLSPCYDVGVQRIRKEKLPMMNMKNPHFASLKCV